VKLIPVGNLFAQVDDDDYFELSQYTWSLIEWKGKRYAKRKQRLSDDPYPKYGTISMHQQITGYDLTDHIDGNGLNNQRSNLRHLSHKKNIQYQLPQRRDKSSKYRGVSWFKPRQKWKARLKIDGREVHVGYFTCEHQAAEAWNKAALKHYGPDSYQNVISTEERR